MDWLKPAIIHISNPYGTYSPERVVEIKRNQKEPATEPFCNLNSRRQEDKGKIDIELPPARAVKANHRGQVSCGNLVGKSLKWYSKDLKQKSHLQKQNLQ